jgi:hypothetical protein
LRSRWSRLAREQDDLIHQAMGLRPVTLIDAATLALCVAEQPGYLEDFEVCRAIHERIGTAAAGILLALRNLGYAC